MTFPVVASETKAGPSTGSPLAVPMPSGITVGDLLIMIAGTRQSEGMSMTGWISLGSSTGSRTEIQAWYRVADGTEGASQDVSFNIGGSAFLAARCVRITDAEDTATQIPEIAFAFDDSATGPGDPPNLVPTGGAKDYLWIAAMCKRDSGLIETFPANYVNTDQAQTAGQSNVLGWGDRDLNAAAEDPGPFGYPVTADWSALTLAIHPGEVTPPGPTVPPLAMHHQRQQR